MVFECVSVFEYVVSLCYCSCIPRFGFLKYGGVVS